MQSKVSYLPRALPSRTQRLKAWLGERSFRLGLMVGAAGPLLMVAAPAVAQLVSSNAGVLARLWDGTNNVVVTNTTPGGSDYGLVVRIAGAAAGGTSSNFGSAFPAAGTAMGLSDGTNMRGGLAIDLDSGAGTQYGQGVNLRKIASGGSVEAGTPSDPLRIDPTGTTTQPVSGTVTANQGGTWTVQPGNTANTTPWLVTGTGGTFPATQSGTWTVQPGNTANTTAWLAKTHPVTGCGSTVFDHALQAAPTIATNITTTTTCVTRVFIANTNATAQTILIQDNQGSPITAVPTVSIPGNSTAIWDLGGTKLTSGVKVTAGGTGVNIAVIGYQ